jgi:hypothetical protein
MLLHRVSVLPDESLIVALLSSLIVALQVSVIRAKNIEMDESKHPTMPERFLSSFVPVRPGQAAHLPGHFFWAIPARSDIPRGSLSTSQRGITTFCLVTKPLVTTDILVTLAVMALYRRKS